MRTFFERRVERREWRVFPFKVGACRFQLVLLAALLCACGKGGDAGQGTGTARSDSIAFRHASLLHVERADSYAVADIRDAWHPGRLLHRYVLVPRSQPLPQHVPEGTLVRTPLRRAVAFTSVHAALLAELAGTGSICGVCDAEYITLPAVRQALDRGEITDMGSSVQPATERIIAARADALLVSPFENAGYGAIGRLGIPLIECADYMETSALGRAEWMRFFGLLFGCEQRADSLFNAVESRYAALSRRALETKSRPTLLCDRKEGAAWYMPGGRSTLGRLYADAGADYLFAESRESGSVPLSFETVYAKAREADVWLIKYGSRESLSYESLRRDFSPYAQFRAWQERRIFACNTFQVPYYEETPFHPDLLLADIVAILHPEALPGHRFRYYRPM